MQNDPAYEEQENLENEQKAYVIGQISIDKDGIWHVHYIGYHKVGFRSYFGNGVESARNIKQLLEVVGSRLNKAKDIYTEKIQEVESNATATEHSSEQPSQS